MKKVLFGIVALALQAFVSCSPSDMVEYGPLAHLAPNTGWMGEPVAAVFHNGVYHVYYQDDPSGTFAEGFKWGHACSTDFVTWTECPVAIDVDSELLLDSGSVVADIRNTSGLGNGSSVPFLAFCSGSDGKSVVLLSSMDEGNTWTKESKFLLPDVQERNLHNPMVCWSEDYGRWLMTVSDQSSVLFFASDNCLDWEYLSEFEDLAATAGHTWTKAQLLKVATDSDDVCKWVLMVSMNNGPASGSTAIRYFVGDFDGAVFSPFQKKELWLDYGKDCNAGIATESDNGIVWIAWMSNWEYALSLPTEGWNGRMCLPRSMRLSPENDHYVIKSQPCADFSELASGVLSVKETKLDSDSEKSVSLPRMSGPFTIDLAFDNKDRMAMWKALDFGVRLYTDSGKYVTFGYNNELGYYYIDREGLGTEAFEGTEAQKVGCAYRTTDDALDMEVIVDGSSLELFGSGGKVNISSLVFPDSRFIRAGIFADGGSASLNGLTVNKLNI